MSTTAMQVLNLLQVSLMGGGETEEEKGKERKWEGERDLKQVHASLKDKAAVNVSLEYIILILLIRSLCFKRVKRFYL